MSSVVENNNQCFSLKSGKIMYLLYLSLHYNYDYINAIVLGYITIIIYVNNNNLLCLNKLSDLKFIS